MNEQNKCPLCGAKLKTTSIEFAFNAKLKNEKCSNLKCRYTESELGTMRKRVLMEMLLRELMEEVS